MTITWTFSVLDGMEVGKARVVIILVCDWSVGSNPDNSLVDCGNFFKEVEQDT